MAITYDCKMTRQLKLYRDICSSYYHGPDELMQSFNISRRMLQRDLKDLRDSGSISLKLDKKTKNYIESENPAVFDDSSTGRRRQHLIRLNRLTTLIDRLERTDTYELDRYESALEEYAYGLELSEEDPQTFPPEEIGEAPVMPELEDIKASYYSLFPESNERMRQRDFKALRDAGFDIYYSHKYRTIIFSPDTLI